MRVNYDRVCRLCLSSRGELLPIFPTTSSDDSEPSGLASKIRDCVSVEINEDDDLPTNVCRKCCDNVNNWHIFKDICERSQNKLQGLIKNDGSQLEEVQIKNEPLSDEAYDDGVVIEGSYPDLECASTSSKVQAEGPPILASLGLTPRSDKNYVDPRMDWQRVNAILDLVQKDEVIDSLQSAEECDVLHHSDHDSESETELSCNTNAEYLDCDNGYLCRNEQIISKNPLSKTNNDNAKVKKVLKRKRKVEKKNCLLPKNVWQLFFTEEILELIVTATNEKIEKHKENYSPSTNMSEIKTFIGILYLHGILRPTNEKYSDLWLNDCGIVCVQNAMKFERFKFLLENLSFHQDNVRDTKQHDIMKPIRTIFEVFALNCRKVFDVNDMVVIDEVLIPIFGPCPFRYCIKKKPIKGGIKMILMVDPTNFYISNIDVITDPYSSAEEIVMKVVQHLTGSGRTIILDSWFTSFKLIETLKKENHLFTILAVNPSNKIIPPFFLANHRKSEDFITGYVDENISLTSYVNTKHKSINILSNVPRFYERNKGKGDSVVSTYKKNQSAVEVIDVLMHYYTTMQNSNNWAHSLFFMLLNIAAVNAQVIWASENSGKIVNRRLFIKELAISLLETKCLSVPLENQLKIKRFATMEEFATPKGRIRCRICVELTKKDRRTQQRCNKCGFSVCKEHSVLICSLCGT